MRRVRLDSLRSLAASLVCLSAAVGCDGCFQFEEPGTTDVDPTKTGVAINEVMARNATSYPDVDGDFDDWVELFNLRDEDRDLSGAQFSDDAGAPDKFVFPQGTTLPAGGFLVFFCDDDTTGGTADEPHAAFKLAGGGESLLLNDADGSALDAFEFPTLDIDQSYGRLPDGEGDADVLEGPSPGGTNAEPIIPDPCEAPFEVLPDLLVNEALVQNIAGLTDDNAEHEPWFELFNAGAVDVDVSDLTISDKADAHERSALPGTGVLAAGSFTVHFADGALDEGDDHVGFTLSANDAAVTVADACGTIIHSLAITGLGGVDQSVALIGNTPTTTTPTPAAANE